MNENEDDLPGTIQSQIRDLHNRLSENPQIQFSDSERLLILTALEVAGDL